MGVAEKNYESQVRSHNKVLVNSTEEEWDKRRDAINKLKSLVKEGVHLRNFIPMCIMVSTPIIECMKSERTQLCNLAMDYVEEIARSTKAEFDPLAEHYLSVILRNCGRTNKIVRLKAGDCLVSILSCAGPTSWFPRMLQDRDNENKDIRSHVIRGLNAVLGVEQANLSPLVSSIEKVLAATVADASPEVREYGFRCYQLYLQRFPERVQSFHSSLDVGALKTLEKLQARKVTANNSRHKQMKAKPAREEKFCITSDNMPGIEVGCQDQISEASRAQTSNQEAPSTEVTGSSEQPEHPCDGVQGDAQIDTCIDMPKPPSSTVASQISVIGGFVPKTTSCNGLTKTNSANHQKSNTVGRTILAGGAQRVLKKVESNRKVLPKSNGKKLEKSKPPSQSLGQGPKKSLVKPESIPPAAKVNRGMATTNIKRTVSKIPPLATKRPHSPHDTPLESVKLVKTTRSSFSRPTASSNAKASAAVEKLHRKGVDQPRTLARKAIGTTGPLRVLRKP
ncbi:hypothetical protein K493DRAFT_320866 [Basidiobolus meristosporus CBS 931.73]|uniref:TOG domain-containing protein n=1 Tax=Basidiobolus meristosporus CBS 931.73 TaxID=1314790 RepID=A0A1Y1X413_9FUNG|nr:hypothetical protein K493DRAFT_320866 [Basidiobolus meristosporus CBS 931.73]|eukprot:ORX80533.1 hypothetical protein K493DRAFT_320866 [Basidiobolus meristosporus CBS 931.73]